MISDPGYRSYIVTLFRQLFDGHPAHVCMLDLAGKIVAVNRSWLRFAEMNDITSGYTFEGESYLDACAAAAERGDIYAQAALTGILDVLTTGRPKFTLTYPCHAPHEKRWFKLWVEPQFPQTPVVIVAHQLERCEPIEQRIPLEMLDG